MALGLVMGAGPSMADDTASPPATDTSSTDPTPAATDTPPAPATDTPPAPAAADVTAPAAGTEVAGPPAVTDAPAGTEVAGPPAVTVASAVAAPRATRSMRSTKSVTTKLAAVSPAAVPANSSLMGGFEIDGDMTGATMTPPGADWSNTPYTALNDGARDATGVKGKESALPSTWTRSAVTLGKADVVNARFANRLVGADQWLYVGLDRDGITGTVYYVLEFNQLGNVTNAAGLSVPNRSNGDLRVTFVQNGNAPLATESVSKWLSGAWVDQTPDPAAIFGLSNADTITDPAGGTLLAGQFAELAFNLASQGFVSGCENTAYSQINFRTRASAAESSDMEDIAGPLNVTVEPRCAFLNINKTGPTTATPLAGATFTVTPNPTTGTGSLLVTDGTTAGMPGAVADGAADGTIALETSRFSPPGFTVQEVDAPTGYLLDPVSQTWTATPFTTDRLDFNDPLGGASWTKLDAVTGAPVAGATFTLTGTGPNGAAVSHIVTDNGAGDTNPAAGATSAAGLYTGTWTITETAAPAGYLLPDGSALQPLGQQVTVSDANPEPAASLSFKDMPKPRLTLVKDIDNAGGGTSVLGDWTLTAAGPTSGVTGTTGQPAVTKKVVDPATYTLSELGTPTGYSSGSWVCSSGGDSVDTVALVGGDDVTCTITNTFVPAAAILLNKTATLNDTNSNGVADAGETIGYSFTVKNTGNVTLTNVTVTDPELDLAITCSPTTLAPGSSADCTTSGTHVVTQSDVDAGGVISNTAEAVATTPTDGTVRDSDTATVPVVAPNALIALDKIASLNDADNDGKLDVGETITYTFVVTNIGNVTLSGVTVTDPMLGTVTCDPTTLAPQETADCTAADHTVTQADIDQGTVTNTATATGTPPGATTPPTATDSTTTPALDESAIEILKTATLNDADRSGFADAGETISYSFVVNNVGNTTLHDVGVTDDMVGPVTCLNTTLAPTASTTCTASSTYTVTQSDVDTRVFISNTAIAVGTSPAGGQVSDDDTANVPVAPAAPAIALVKTATLGDTNNNSVADSGETIGYSFAVTNTGNVTLADITVADPQLGAAGVTCSATTLAPQATTICTTAGTYTVTPADIVQGDPIVNTATATGTAATGDKPTDQDTATVPVAAVVQLGQPNITLIAEVVNNFNGTAKVRDFTLTGFGILVAPASVVRNVAGAQNGAALVAPLAALTSFSGLTGDVAITNATVGVGTYSLSESALPSGYSKSAWVCEGGVQDGSNITVAMGNTISCVIVNTDSSTPVAPTPPASPIPSLPPVVPHDPAAPILAFTGAGIVPMGLTGLIALALGAVLTAAGRRRARV
jgi:uncharacterized repeat protein (TIGR01451 family)